MIIVCGCINFIDPSVGRIEGSPWRAADQRKMRADGVEEEERVDEAEAGLRGGCPEC